MLNALAILSSVALLVAGRSHHALARSHVAASSPRAVVMAMARSSPTPEQRAAQSAADKRTAQKQRAQSAADKVHAGTLAGSSAAVVNSAQIEQLLVEVRRAREASEKLLAETKTAARAAALRFGIEHSEDDEFDFTYYDRWRRSTPSKSGWVVEEVLYSFLHGRKCVLNDLFNDDIGDPGWVGDTRTNENEAAFALKLAEQIDKLIGVKPIVRKKKIIYDDAKDMENDDFERTLSLPPV